MTLWSELACVLLLVSVSINYLSRSSQVKYVTFVLSQFCFIALCLLFNSKLIALAAFCFIALILMSSQLKHLVRPTRHTMKEHSALKVKTAFFILICLGTGSWTVYLSHAPISATNYFKSENMEQVSDASRLSTLLLSEHSITLGIVSLLLFTALITVKKLKQINTKTHKRIKL